MVKLYLGNFILRKAPGTHSTGELPRRSGCCGSEKSLALPEIEPCVLLNSENKTWSNNNTSFGVREVKT
jgi:hypothetical protein